jgi:hypothetical protein
MIFAVHQPQYLPWLGYFHKIAKSEFFLFLDDVQYKKREFQNRNQIKTPNGPLWLTVPVLTKGAYDQNIMDVKIDPTERWAQSHWKSIEINYRKAPYFEEHAAFFRELYQKEWLSLMDVSMEIIKYVLKYLEIQTPHAMSSEYKVSTQSTERIIDLAKKCAADTYYSGSGGKAYMDESLFEKNGIKLVYQHYEHPVYDQLHGEFKPYMSIIDLLFNCGKESYGILMEGN